MYSTAALRRRRIHVDSAFQPMAFSIPLRRWLRVIIMPETHIIRNGDDQAELVNLIKNQMLNFPYKKRLS